MKIIKLIFKNLNKFDQQIGYFIFFNCFKTKNVILFSIISLKKTQFLKSGHLQVFTIYLYLHVDITDR